MKKDKPTFGRKMDPCAYESKWANKLPKEEVIEISAYERNEEVKEER